MRFILLVLFSVFLAACTYTAAMVIKPNEVYQGYPCGSQCDAFKQGYETAQSKQLTHLSDCHGNNLDEVAGCQAGVAEYQRTLPTFSDLNLK
jgi:hypothetical protein